MLTSGPVNVEDLQPAFAEGMQQLVALHGRTGVGDTGEYLPPKLTDRLAWAFSDWLTSSGFMVSPTPSSVKPLKPSIRNG